MVYNDGQAFNANEQVVLAPNGKVGRVEQPFVLHAGNGDLSLFPNPAERGEQVQIALPASFDAENATVEVFNALGARVNIQALSKGSLDLQGMTAAGLYTVKLTDQKGNVLYGKLVVR
ncbi:MAG: T9SS type A sorting domain-containing protein [Bacteroidales bacterium]|nr:T9SS type A sorting domain-containing protein [Bacteroidales bacterium]